MTTYQVQKGDTIAKVTALMDMNWKSLKRLNPEAVGRSEETGRWFLREGAAVRDDGESFEAIVHSSEGPGAGAPLSPVSRRKGDVEYTIKPGDTLWALAVKRFHVNVEDLIRDNGITDPRRLMPGQKILIRRPDYPDSQHVVASWYGNGYHGRPMANGDFFNMYANTIAHKDLPLGTRVVLENAQTGQTEEAVVTDRGPYIDGRDVDLSFGLAKKLSLLEKGVGKLTMRVLG